MKTEKSIKTVDQWIRRRVQVLEQDIPAELEVAFYTELERITPEKFPFFRRRFAYYGVWAIAASILLAVFLILFPLFFQPGNQVDTEYVWIHTARVEGQPARTFVINQKDSDMTIIWIEKIK